MAKKKTSKQKRADYTSSGIPVVPLAKKLEYLSACILDGSYEDALGHLDDLRDSIHLRACLRGIRKDDLTTDGIKLLRYTEADDQAQTQQGQARPINEAKDI